MFEFDQKWSIIIENGSKSIENDKNWIVFDFFDRLIDIFIKNGSKSFIFYLKQSKFNEKMDQ